MKFWQWSEPQVSSSGNRSEGKQIPAEPSKHDLSFFGASTETLVSEDAQVEGTFLTSSEVRRG